jgi:stage V sporulation protein G
MPSRRDEAGKFRDVAHPISKEVRENFEKVVLDSYSRFLEESENADEEPDGEPNEFSAETADE